MVKKLKVQSKFSILAIFIILICCVGAVSATDEDGTDDVIPDEIVMDDVVEEVDVDDASDSVVDEKNGTRGSQSQVTSTTYDSFFDSDGNLLSSVSDSSISFTGTFSNMPFSNFIINKQIGLDLTGATFNNVGFKLIASGITLTDGTINMDATTQSESAIYIGASNVTVSGVIMDITANPSNDSYAVNMLNAENAKLLNNAITFNATTTADKYNHVIRVVNSTNVEVSGNNITAFLPLKAVNFEEPFPSIYTDYPAVVAVQSSNKFNLRNNKIEANVSCSDNNYPTLDVVIMVDSNSSYVEYNNITQFDTVTGLNQVNYLYAVDFYKCYNSYIKYNNIAINSKGGIVVTNGSGAAYPIQLTGPYRYVYIEYNNLTSANNGPNIGIYSQNFYGETNNLIIRHNNINITGKSNNNPYSLVTGIETQDTYSTITYNNIYVNNTAGYNPNYYAFGISYAQSTPNMHRFNIRYNHVTVENGKYAVYLLSATNSSVSNNYLTTNVFTGNDAVNIISGSGNTVKNNGANNIANSINIANYFKSMNYSGRIYKSGSLIR